MKFVLVVACLAGLCSGAHAEERGHLLRRITLAASCAASLWDYQTTAAAASYGAIEKNGLMADSQGRPRLGLIFGIKAGICAAAAVAQETHLLGRSRSGSRAANRLWTSVNAGLAMRFTGMAIHNLGVIRTLQRQGNSAVPAYLAPTQ